MTPKLPSSKTYSPFSPKFEAFRIGFDSIDLDPQRGIYGGFWMKKKDYHLEIKRFVTLNNKNQYLLISDNEAAVIDVFEAHREVGKILDIRDLDLKYLLITHGHKLHVQALPWFKENYGGVFCLHEFEYELLPESESSLVADRELKDGSKLPLGDVALEVLLTAGHTKGSVCYYIRGVNALFSGSTLLRKGYGKIWGPNSMSLMLFSLKRLGSTIPAETDIYTGSGELTKMENEGWIHCLRSA